MKFKYRRYIFRYNPILVLIHWLKRIKLKRYNVSLYQIIKLLIKNLYNDDILERANGVSFNFILAIFPAIIFLFTLTPYIFSFFPALDQTSIMLFLSEYTPPSMFEAIESTIMDIISNQRGGLLTFGFVFSLYLATNGMMALMRAFNAVYKTVERRSAWRMRLTATGLTFGLSFVLVIAIILLVVGELALDYLLVYLPDFAWFHPDNYTVQLLMVLRFIVLYMAFFLAFSMMYYFGPAVHYNWRFFSVGSTIATIGSLAISYGFSYYITNFGTYNRVYGSIGVLIAIMIWIQLITIVILIGYEVNATIHSAAVKQALWEGRRKRRVNSKLKPDSELAS